jgi:hypothetical protein
MSQTITMLMNGKCVRNCLKVSAAIVLALQGVAWSSVPPEVPEIRTAQLFSPIDSAVPENGQSVLLQGGPGQQGYHLYLDWRRTDAPSTDRPNVGLRQFVQTLSAFAISPSTGARPHG